MNSKAAASNILASLAAANVEVQGYQILQTTCGGKTHTFPTLTGEALLVEVDAMTGKLRAI